MVHPFLVRGPARRVVITSFSGAETFPPVTSVVEESLAREASRSTWDQSRNAGLLGVGAGTALATLLTGLLWSRRISLPCNAKAGARVSDAADGLPRATDLRNWSLPTLTEVVTIVAESDDFIVSKVGGSPRELLLTRTGRTSPSVMVYCIAGPEGHGTVAQVLEFVEALSRSKIATGWLVCPHGLTRKAHKLALSHQNILVVVDDEVFLHMLRGVSPLVASLMLPKLA